MSRKIGLGDTYFDPDIDGDIDFDFFGGVTASAFPADHSPAADGAEAAVKGRPVSPSSSKQLLDNNNHYDTRMFNLNQQHQKSEVGKEEQNKREKLGNGFDSAIAEIEQSRHEIEQSNYRNSLENDNFKNTHHPMDTNHLDSGERQLTDDAKNAEEEVKNMKTESLVELVQQQQQQEEEDNDEPVFSECDSASDLYSLTDEDSFDDGDEDEGDDCLDSDITEVSPLSSANMSPLPESPKRTPEPKLKRQLLMNNHSLSPNPKPGDGRIKGDASMVRSGAQSSSSSTNGSEKLWSRGKKNGSNTSSCSGSESGHDTVDLKVLAKAILELEEERKRNGSGDTSSCRDRQSMGGYGRPRKNMTFTNDEVRRIDHENKRLLRRIIDSQKPRKRQPSTLHHSGPKVASSAINRVKELRKIETENLVLLKRLQAAKPTRELSREFLLGAAQHRGATPYMPESKSSSSLATSHTSFSTNMPGGSSRGRSSRCHSTGSLSSMVGSSATSGSTAASSARCKLTRPTKGVTVAAHSIPSER